MSVAWNSTSTPRSWSTAKNYKHKWNPVQKQMISVHAVPGLWASFCISLSSEILSRSERISFSVFHRKRWCMGIAYPLLAARPTSASHGPGVMGGLGRNHGGGKPSCNFTDGFKGEVVKETFGQAKIRTQSPVTQDWVWTVICFTCCYKIFLGVDIQRWQIKA